MTIPNTPARRRYYHVAAKTHYEEVDGGLVRVTSPDGRSGVFRASGEWMSGELTQCNLHMLEWCGGPDIPKHFNYRWTEVPFDGKRSSGWPEEHERTLQRERAITIAATGKF